jgi:hypothetical protein
MNVTTDTNNLLVDPLKVIDDEQHYQLINNYGQACCLRSNDTSIETIYCLIKEDDLVEKARKSNKPPYLFEKTLTGVSFKASSPWGKQFYDLMTTPKGTIPQPFDVSENSTLLYEIAKKLNLPEAFSGNPLSVITIDGLLEGELINTLFNRLHEAANRKGFKQGVDERKRQVAQLVSASKRYVTRVVESTPNLFVFRLEIGYQPGLGGSVDLKLADRHLQKFLEQLQAKIDPDTPLRFWYKRWFVSEAGYRTHLILFFDLSKICCDDRFFQTLASHWREVTEDKGVLFSHQSHQESHKRWGAGFLYSVSDLNCQSLLKSLKLMLEVDRLLYLVPHPEIKHVGMGLLPKALSKPKPLQATTPQSIFSSTSMLPSHRV